MPTAPPLALRLLSFGVRRRANRLRNPRLKVPEARLQGTRMSCANRITASLLKPESSLAAHSTTYG